MQLHELTIIEAAEGLKNKQFSSVELTRFYLDRIEKYNPQLNVFLSISEKAFERAGAADEKLARGEAGPLVGIPVAIKDNMVIAGEKTTAASKMLENYTAPYTATAVKKLESAGAVILGKTNLDEFAMGASTENSAFGPSKNPWNKEFVPGGTSGGSAVSVAADLAVYSLGSDTGGSIRQPASLCGVVGLKPTYGRVSRAGLMAMTSSLDQIGPITKTVRDAGLVLNELAGFDPKDATTLDKAPEDFTAGIEDGIQGLRVGVPKEFFTEGLDPQVRQNVEVAIAKLKDLGAEIVQVSLPILEYALATYYIIVPVEVASNMARYDGIKYGLSVDGDYYKTRDAGFGPEVKRRIILGTYASSAGYYDAYYKKALAVQQMIREEFKKVFEKVDIIAGSTSPTTAFKIGEKVDNPLAMYLADIFTVPVNIAGLPAISVPCGFAKGLPVGLQLIGAWWNEAKLLRAAYTFEQSTEWHKRRPDLSS
ncbi:MAG: Asp-tRNA(Asn)/Glu-tRNA(Gln) amidotransferase subunit GatA [Candidatus Doudnabacteria bacterium]|nr:Asp-tRNA(Asn)/Glu-tRNA(Gln) amidotransferase subunit GatA [Candidatus Doudnabacteria bacterium]